MARPSLKSFSVLPFTLSNHPGGSCYDNFDFCVHVGKKLVKSKIRRIYMHPLPMIGNRAPFRRQGN